MIIPLTTSQCTIGEELPMTMQVGMVGTNGIVIAGDTHHSVSPMFANLMGVRHGYGSTKIRTDEAGRVAVTCAMDMRPVTR
jgi:hypothetical protein